METQHSINTTLKTLGLPRDAAAIYALLLSDGPQKASELVRKSRISRPLTYRALDDLVARQLVSSDKKRNRVTVFEAENPRIIKNSLDSQIQDLETSKKLFESLLPTLLAQFSRISEKPSFRYEDTLQGVVELFSESNFAESTVYQYIDPTIMESSKFKTITEKLTRQRLAADTHKILLYPDTEFSRTYITTYPDFEHYIIPGFPALPAVLVSYDDVVLLISISESNIRGYSVTDTVLAQIMQRFLQNSYKAIS